MFEKLIVSNTRETGSEGRSRYFIISSLVVLTLFTTAVVLSLYAADISIGDHEFDMARMVAPITAELPEEARQNDVRQPASTPASELPVRNENIAQVTRRRHRSRHHFDGKVDVAFEAGRRLHH
ncbi:MAG: hypothetical protein IPM25_13815 [Chloracidobacterium sp.]|nr:hypothetical protein [Chloracidobacterium sp.]